MKPSRRSRRESRVKLAAVILTGFGLGLAWLALAAPPADCAWCPPAPCLSSTSCGDCECLVTGDETHGRCVARIGDD
jgi:hypothetical protein